MENKCPNIPQLSNFEETRIRYWNTIWNIDNPLSYCCQDIQSQYEPFTVLLGSFSGYPSAVGAGMLAQSKQDEFLEWKRVIRVKYKPRQCVIQLRGSWTENIAVFCTRDNFVLIKEFVTNSISIM